MTATSETIPVEPDRRRTHARVLTAIAAEVTIASERYPAEIHNLSQRGAFLSDLPKVAIGTEIEVAIHIAGYRVSTRGTVRHWVDDDETTGGAGIWFRDPVEETDATFGAAVAWLVSQPEPAHPSPRSDPPPHVGKPTRRILGPVLHTIVAAMNQPEVIFSGSLEEFELASFLTMLAIGRISGQLTLEHGHATASIEMHAGQVVAASASVCTEGLLGVMMVVLDWETGTFELAKRTSTVDGRDGVSVAELLLDHAKQRDEAARTDHRQRQ